MAAAFVRPITFSPATGRFAPTFAEVCSAPQVFNAKRHDCTLDPYPTLMGVFDRCLALAAFDQAQPGKQPDAA